MGSWALLVWSLLGFLCVEPGFGQRGDMDVGEWMRAQETLTKDLQENQRHVETQQKDLEALEARLNATVDELTGQKADMDKLKEENKGTR